MAKRRAKIKLSKAQVLENDTNKWLAKKAAAIDMLVKAMEHLKVCERSSRRLQKAALGTLPPKRKTRPVTRAAALEPTPQASLDVTLTPEQRDQRMEAMGFRKTKRTRSKAQPVV